MALLLGFDLALELLEAAAPEVVEERAQLDQPFGADAVDTSSAVATLAHQPSAVQDAQVLRDRLPGDVEVPSDPPRGHLLVAHQSQDLPSSRLDYGLECCLHAAATIPKSARMRLRKCLPAGGFSTPASGLAWARSPYIQLQV